MLTKPFSFDIIYLSTKPLNVKDKVISLIDDL